VRALVAVDLDGTLIHPARDGAGVVVEELDGAPLSVVTPRAWALARTLGERHHLVPVTTRTPEQYARVRLPAPPRWAVCANGAVLLADGDPDPEWEAWARGLCSAAAPLAEVAARVGVDAPWVRTWRVAAGSFLYVVAHSRAAIPAGWLAELDPWLAGRGWALSVQGRKVYAVPAALTKAAAVARLRGALEAPPLLAAGDAVLDAELLAGADAAVRPASGELHDRGWTCPGLHVTAAGGAVGGEELLAWLLAAAGGA